MRILTTAALGVACTLFAGVANAQSAEDKKEAVRLFDEGSRFYNAGDLDKALTTFQKALEKDDKQPGSWRWLGLIYRAKKQCKESIDAYTHYLRLQGDKTARFTERVHSEIEICRKELGYAPIPKDLPAGSGALAVSANIDGAQVSVDGIARGATPIEPLPVTPGSHEIQLARPCYLTVTQSVEILGKHVTDIRIELQKDPAAPKDKCDEQARKAPVAVATTGVIRLETPAKPSSVLLDGQPIALRADGSFEGAPGIHTLKVDTPDHEEWERRVVIVRGEPHSVPVVVRTNASRRNLRIGAWSAMGVALASGAVGLYYGIKESDTFDKARDLHQIEANRSTGNPTPFTTREELAKLEKDANGQRNLSMITLGVAGAALATSVVLFVLERDERTEGQEPPMATPYAAQQQARPRRIAVAPVPLPGGAGIVLSGRTW